jgi:hypothetical protein
MTSAELTRRNVVRPVDACGSPPSRPESASYWVERGRELNNNFKRSQGYFNTIQNMIRKNYTYQLHLIEVSIQILMKGVRRRERGHEEAHQ